MKILNYLLSRTLSRYLLFALIVMPIFIFRDFTPENELRYLSIADEALRNGSFFTFSNHGIPYADKPPLYIWIVMAGKLFFGYHNLLFLGLFSLIPALVVVYVLDQWVKNRLSENQRLAGQLMLITSVYFIGSSLVLRMDMLMSMFIVLSLYTFFKIYSGTARTWDSFLFPFYIFMAIFTKGPLGFIIPLVSTIVFLLFSGKIKSAGRYWGLKTLTVLIVLCLPWFAAVYAEGGILYLDNLLFNQTIHRAVNSFHHKAPFYYYVETIWYVLAPWSLLTAGVIVRRLKMRSTLTELELFFVVTGLSTFMCLSIFSAKLAVYMLPALPFFIYLTILWIPRQGSPFWILFLAGVPAGLLSMALPAVFIAKQFIHTNGIGISPMIVITALILSVTGIQTIRTLFSGRLNPAIIMMSLGLLLATFSVSFAIPRYNSFIGLGELCNDAKQIAAGEAASNYYYCELSRGDNLDIYLGVIPKMLKMHDLYEIHSPLKKPALIFLWNKSIERNDSLQSFIKGKNVLHSGNYSLVEIK